MRNDGSAMHFDKIVFIGPLVSTVSVMKIFESSVIVVRWDKVANVTNYTVTWTSDGTLLSSRIQIEQLFTLNGSIDTVYNISVAATNSLCTGPEFITSVLFSAGMYLPFLYLLYVIYPMHIYSKQVCKQDLFSLSQCCDKPTLHMTVLRDNCHN